MIHASHLSLSSAALALVLAAGPQVAAQEAPFSAPANFSQLAEARLPSVVGIIATGAEPTEAPTQQPMLPPGLQDFFGFPMPERAPQGPRQALGSGFIISEDGFVVTNDHVIAGAESIEVTLGDDRRVTAELIGTDPATDIALLKVNDASDLPAVEWGTSRDLKIGEWVVAIGNPFGLGGTVTAGIVSAQSRNINSGPYDDFIQTDAAINSGNSGGPLFNALGDVIGVNTAIFSPTGGSVGIGFAVPAHVAQRVVEDLKDDGMVERGWLGVQIQPVSDDIAEAVGLSETTGALVNDVTMAGPAFNAGLQVGDIILEVGNEAVEDPRDLVLGVAEKAVGDIASLTVWRDGARITLETQIGLRPNDRVASLRPDARPGDDQPRLGVTVAPLSPELRAELDLPDSLEGLVINGVTEGSAASQAGLAQGDVIVSVGDRNAIDFDVMRRAIEEAEANERPVLMRVYRSGAYRFVAVPLDENA